MLISEFLSKMAAQVVKKRGKKQHITFTEIFNKNKRGKLQILSFYIPSKWAIKIPWLKCAQLFLPWSYPTAQSLAWPTFMAEVWVSTPRIPPPKQHSHPEGIQVGKMATFEYPGKISTQWAESVLDTNGVSFPFCPTEINGQVTPTTSIPSIPRET